MQRSDAIGDLVSLLTPRVLCEGGEDVARRRLCLGERDLRVNTFKVSIVVSRITLWRVRNRAARIASCASARRTCASKERPKVERTAA